MRSRLAGWTALVTGASSGIGWELSRQLAGRVGRLVLTARSKDRLEELAAVLPCESMVLPADLSSQDDVTRMLEDLGDLGIDLLVNNAGVGLVRDLTGADAERWLEIMNVNAVAPLRLTHHLLPGMLARGRGAILNIGSTAAFQGVPRFAVYAATKAFLNVLGEGLAWELERSGITVTTVHPGATRTRFGEAAEIPIEQMIAVTEDPFEVASAAIVALEKGKRMAVSGALNKALVQGQRFVPRWIVGTVARRIFRPLDRARRS